MNAPVPERRREVNWILWLGLPAATLAAKFLLPLLGPETWEAFWIGELGFVENGTVVFLIPAIVVSVLIFLRRRELPPGIGWVMLLLALASFYFAGEEISWGQQYFGWETPEFLKNLNRQGETNIHNTLGKYGGNILNNLPRQLLNAALILAIVFPIAIPLLKRRFDREGERDAGNAGRAIRRLVDLCTDRRSQWCWLVPSYRLSLVAAMGLGLRLAQKIVKAAGVEKDDSYLGMSLLQAAGEFLEYCFALAIMLFVLSIYARMGPKSIPE